MSASYATESNLPFSHSLHALVLGERFRLDSDILHAPQLKLKESG